MTSLLCLYNYDKFFTGRELFQTIDESFTAEAINFTASLLKQRNFTLDDQQCSLLAEVCVHCSNTLILISLRSDEYHRQLLVQQIEDLIVSYLSPYLGDELLHNKVMEVMKCPRQHLFHLCQFCLQSCDSRFELLRSFFKLLGGHPL